jgi:hypothetical protein
MAGNEDSPEAQIAAEIAIYEISEPLGSYHRVAGRGFVRSLVVGGRLPSRGVRGEFLTAVKPLRPHFH